jgi:hypothetical protein
MRPLRLVSAVIGGSIYPVTLVIGRHGRTVRGCQNIMGFSDGADQGTKAKTKCTVEAARRGKQEDTLLYGITHSFQ